MRAQKTILCLILLLAVPLCAQQEAAPSKYGWGADFRDFYNYIFGKKTIEHIKQPQEPTQQQLIVEDIEPAATQTSQIVDAVPIAENSLLRVVNILGNDKMHRDAMTAVLKRATDEQLIDIYKATNMLSYLHKQQMNGPGYPATEIQKLQKRLFTSPADGNFILLEALYRAEKKVAKKLGCSLNDLQNKRCTPILKPRGEDYTNEELRTNFLRSIAPSYHENWIECLEHLALIDTSNLRDTGIFRNLSGYLGEDIDAATQLFVVGSQKRLREIKGIETALRNDLLSGQVSIVPIEGSGYIFPKIFLKGTINTPQGQKNIDINCDAYRHTWSVDVNNNKFIMCEYQNPFSVDLITPGRIDIYNKSTLEDVKILRKIVTRVSENLNEKRIESNDSALLWLLTKK